MPAKKLTRAAQLGADQLAVKFQEIVDSIGKTERKLTHSKRPLEWSPTGFPGFDFP